MSALELNDLQKIQKQVDELRINQYLKLSKDYIDNELHLIEMELFKLMDKLCDGYTLPDTESKCNKHGVINCVPYQTCPKCGGDGNLLRYNSPNLLGMTVPICDVCEGKKIIPMAHCL
ncbi:MAG TPA: hypothetical protein DHV48_03560 [Prolixibacteraceae bacterium]|nr:hypothetical protein [Prolixibacteraceae bacterium]